MYLATKTKPVSKKRAEEAEEVEEVEEMRGAAHMKNATACPFLGGGTPGLLSMEGKSSNELLQHGSHVSHTSARN
jgi:hypothetical protein